MDRTELLKSVSNTISDYRLGEINIPNPDHVDRWVSQFDKDDQITILKEMNHILGKFYFSKDKIKNMLRSILSNKNIFGDDVANGIKKHEFLNIQSQGNSQKELLKLVETILLEEYDINIENCGGSNKYFYIDDCVFTGNKFRYDIENWIANNYIENNSEIVSYHIGLHETGWNYAINKIKSTLNPRNISITCWRHMDIK